MNCAAEEEVKNFFQNPDNNDSESSENFQIYITELFEKNGILSDLRAYLRGHIVNVLKSAETGVTPTFQKHFTQRLELVYQALNMLIAEYLLRLEFSYSFSVFLSEIPLANMVFTFAKNLLQATDTNALGLRFTENDVWSVLHYLGLKCDSVYAAKIINLYKHGDSPLLHCILKCIPMYNKEPSCLQEVIESDECLSSSAKSAESYEDKPKKCFHGSHLHKCKHYAFCKSCQKRLLRLREKYKKRKTEMGKMFQQLKTVYEAEVDIIKEEEERRIKRSIANHALQLQKHREKMEESYRAREAELEKNVHQKKKFLWGLARALRSQHEHMTLAMRDVQYETKRLAEKESGIKIQLDEAEQILKKRGEEMRNQISQELIVLEGNLETMKKERDTINKERDELEKLKNSYEINNKLMNQKDVDDNVDLKTHYIKLKDEMVILKSYIESTKESKCLIERGTVTELGDGVMNNSVGVRSDDDDDDKLKGSQVIHDLKKQKNVNFSQTNLDEIYRQLSRTPSRSLTRVYEGSTTRIRGSDPGCATCNNCDNGGSNCDSGTNVTSNGAQSNHGCDGCRGCNQAAMFQLREENDRLKAFARQQREHIDSLSRERERLQTHLVTNSRPRTAPSVLASNFFPTNRTNPTTSANAFGWRKGAGEELNIFSTSEPRVILPGEPVPFIGVLTDRHSDSRRHLISQWRALRRRLSPQTNPRPVASMERSSQHITDHAEINIPLQESDANLINGGTTQALVSDKPQKMRPAVDKPREKSPKTFLREAKEKLKNNNIKEPPAPRDKSPNAMLREAKMRLRKLEIEAEAVEKSYLDFRKRQSELREEKQNLVLAESSLIKTVNKLETKTSKSSQSLNAPENIANDIFDCEKSSENMKKDFDKYLREYQTNFDIGKIYFQNKNSAIQRIKPIPPSHNICEENEEPKQKNINYLETPLSEFRKFYQTQNRTKRKVKSPISKEIKELETTSEARESDKTVESKSEKNSREIIRNIKNNKRAELEILKQNISKIYNLPETSTPNDTGLGNIPEIIVTKTNAKDDSKEELEENVDVQENKLLLQVQNVRETNNVGVTESKQDLLMIVESSIDNRDTSSSENENEEQKLFTQITVIVSPKDDNSSTVLKSPCKELSEKVTLNNDTLNAIFHTEDKDLSSVDMKSELNKDGLENEVEKDAQKEYLDDFSADVDNYYNTNSISDGGKNSPISLPKTSEDENFWEN
ncbi:uncharacterized protein LOC120625339 isoform X2 [Pararge aegeria]|uniref:uncharacterized protein LOC120625339 isoform X2 n=1 Tax=Pararge aegeria TaxID=116150 RepID=UPI0019D0F23B|nr:uncharacterized protein LOC120625339 isoform X2 [Pararge aegeria]